MRQTRSSGDSGGASDRASNREHEGQKPERRADYSPSSTAFAESRSRTGTPIPFNG